MVCQLERYDHEKTRLLFQGQHLALVIEAVIAGNSPALNWSDHITGPRTALMWDKAPCFYLVGAMDNLEFNRTLSELVVARIFPEARRRGLTIFKVYYTHTDWEAHIPAISPNIAFRKLERVFYAFDQLKLGNEEDCLPVGFQMQAIDQSLLTNTELTRAELAM